MTQPYPPPDVWRRLSTLTVISIVLLIVSSAIMPAVALYLITKSYQTIAERRFDDTFEYMALANALVMFSAAFLAWSLLVYISFALVPWGALLPILPTMLATT